MNTKIEKVATVIGMVVAVIIIALIGTGTLASVSAIRNEPFELFAGNYGLSDLVAYILTGVATIAGLGIPATAIIIGLSAKN